MDLLRGVVTQNIDNLHQEAGNTNVIEMHGSIYRQRCLACGGKKVLSKEEFLGMARDIIPQLKNFQLESIMRQLPSCDECGSPMRPDVVMFGEAVQGINQAFQLGESCTAMLVLGTSGVVYPAAALPHRAKAAGATVIEINPGESSYYGFADIYIEAKTGEAMPMIIEKLQQA